MFHVSNLQQYFHDVTNLSSPVQNSTSNNTIHYDDEDEDEDCYSDCSTIISPCSLSSHSSSSSLNSQFSIQDSSSLDFPSTINPGAAATSAKKLQKPLFSLFNNSSSGSNKNCNANASSDSISTVVLSNGLFQENSGSPLAADDRTEQHNLSPSFCNTYHHKSDSSAKNLSDNDDSTDELSQVDCSDLEDASSTNVFSTGSEVTTASTSSSAENLFEKLTAISCSSASGTPCSSISNSTITSPPPVPPNSSCISTTTTPPTDTISRTVSRSSSYSTASNTSLKSSMRSSSYGSLSLKKRVSFASNDLEDVCFFDKYDTPRSVGSTSDEEYSDEEEYSGEEEQVVNNEKMYCNDMFTNYFNSFDILSKNNEDDHVGRWKMYKKNFMLGNEKSLKSKNSANNYNNNIRLEKLSVKNNIMFGHVLVSNLAFEKQVKLKYTTNNWATFNQINLYFKSCKDSNTDRFSFKLNLNSKKFERLQKQQTLLDFEFCLCYSVNNYKYWDNNNNLNYKLKLFKGDSSEKEYGYSNSEYGYSNSNNAAATAKGSTSRIFRNESNVSKINKWWTSSNNKSYDQVISDYCFYRS